MVRKPPQGQGKGTAGLKRPAGARIEGGNVQMSFLKWSTLKN